MPMMMPMPFCYMPVFDMCCPMCGHGHMPTHHYPQMMQPYPQMPVESYPQAQPYPPMPQMPSAPGYTLPIAEGMPEYAMPAEHESTDRGWKMGESTSVSSSLDTYLGDRHDHESPMMDDLQIPQMPQMPQMHQMPEHMYQAESTCGCSGGQGPTVPYAVQAAAWPYWPQPSWQPFPGHHHGNCCNVCGSPFGYGGY